MYGKLESGILLTAPKQVSYNGNTVFNPPENIMRELGYLPIVHTGMTADAPTGQHYESHWEQTGAEIRQVWELVDNPEEPLTEPTMEERMEIVEGAVLELSEILYA